MELIFGQKSIKQPLRDLLPYGLIYYADSNFAGDQENAKSVRVYYFILNKAVIF